MIHGYGEYVLHSAQLITVKCEIQCVNSEFYVNGEKLSDQGCGITNSEGRQVLLETSSE